ncbi:unnamed protein product [Brassica rapa subsp. trilocularis]
MADVEPEVAAAGVPKKRTFKKFAFKGVDLDALLDMSTDDLVKLFPSRIRRRFSRGLTRKPMALIKKLRKAKREAPQGEKPEPVRTHLRNMIIVPEMIGSIIGVYNGKTFNQVEIKPEMIGHYLAEFSISYKPVKHGRPGVVISGIKETVQSINGAARPWGDFLDLSAFSFPSSFSDATTRLTQNLTHFRINYTIILSLLLALTLITRPIAILAFVAVGLAWFFLYFAREEALTVFGFTVDDGVVAVLLIGLTIAALVTTGVWLSALTTVGFGALVLILHAALRGTEDLVTDDLESPYGPMLSTAGGDNGDYSGI